ncbi:MAG: FAD-dependent oxidoreductase, partial [Muribaculaceae bacterium]|nr:FAD-dependent oxidoreductase [Muribaculaceae bacterium]
MEKNGNRPKVVVVGGGFAGLNFVKHLDAEKFDITLIDRNNYHSFPPLFYQVASSGLDPSSICFPLRRELRKRHGAKVAFNLGAVTEIDIARRVAITHDEEVPYDFLIIAAGTTNNFFNMPELLDKVFTIKSTPEALRCRNEVLSLLEKAAIEPDAAKRRGLLSFVVVGGGPSGVEIAGALGEMKKYVLPREYPSINPDDISITLVEGSDKVLGSMSGKSSAAAAKALGDLMVDLRLGSGMTSYADNEVRLADGARLPASMVIWTAGVKAEGFRFTSDGIPLDRPIAWHAGRLPVDRFCRVNGLANVFALGDVSIVEGDPDYEKGHPQLAQVAIQQGRLLARNLNRDAADAGEWKRFRYN